MIFEKLENPSLASKSKGFELGALAGALLLGAAPMLVNFAFSTGQSVPDSATAAPPAKTTPAPKANMTKVPRNSANISRRIVDAFIPDLPALSLPFPATLSFFLVNARHCGSAARDLNSALNRAGIIAPLTVRIKMGVACRWPVLVIFFPWW